MTFINLIDYTAVVAPGKQDKPATEDERIWLNLFDSLYATDAEAYDKYQEYYDGDQKIVWNHKRFQEIFGSNFLEFRDNWCETVVDATAERLVVIGFNVSKFEEETVDPELQAGDAGAQKPPATQPQNGQGNGTVPPGSTGAIKPPPGDPYADPVPLPKLNYNPEQPKNPDDQLMKEVKAKASAIWKRNRLDAVQEIVHSQALVKGKAYLICWPDDETGNAEIYFNDAILIRCWYDEEGELEVAAKQWRRADGKLRRNLYFRERVEKWILSVPVGAMTSAKEAQRVTPFGTGNRSIEWDRWADEGDDQWPLDNPYGRVPVIPFINKPHHPGEGQSEIKNTIPQQDAINKELADMLVSSEYGAFNQKIIASKGRPKEGWKHGPNQLWSTSDTDAKWGQFDATPLRNFIDAVDMWVQHVASTSRTPHHYFFTTGDAPSGEALRAAEAGLVKKVEKKQVHFGNSWEDAIRFAIEIEEGESYATDLDINATWKSAETRIEKDFWETLQIKSALGIPDEVLWEEAGYSPAQVAEMRGINDSKQSQNIGDMLLNGFTKGTGGGAQGNPLAPPNASGGVKAPPPAAFGK